VPDGATAETAVFLDGRSRGRTHPPWVYPVRALRAVLRSLARTKRGYLPKKKPFTRESDPALLFLSVLSAQEHPVELRHRDLPSGFSSFGGAGTSGCSATSACRPP